MKVWNLTAPLVVCGVLAGSALGVMASRYPALQERVDPDYGIGSVVALAREDKASELHLVVSTVPTCEIGGAASALQFVLGERPAQHAVLLSLQGTTKKGSRVLAATKVDLRDSLNRAVDATLTIPGGYQGYADLSACVGLAGDNDCANAVRSATPSYEGIFTTDIKAPPALLSRHGLALNTDTANFLTIVGAGEVVERPIADFWKRNLRLSTEAVGAVVREQRRDYAFLRSLPLAAFQGRLHLRLPRYSPNDCAPEVVNRAAPPVRVARQGQGDL